LLTTLVARKSFVEILAVGERRGAFEDHQKQDSAKFQTDGGEVARWWNAALLGIELLIRGIDRQELRQDQSPE
jgi:hypothetical protein